MTTSANRKQQTATGRFGAGRPRGAPNKLTRSAKEAFQLAFDALGGADTLAAWARDNQTDFYRLFARLIPVDAHVSDPNGEPIHFTLYVPPKQSR